ncbi:MAG TPA: iron-containing alcohol dehydrogenase [Clostridiales bacterium]|nr:iron-containing alcohol dehydrogenase [Clostridiales bacterium]
MEFNYYMPTKIYYGRGVIDQYKNDMENLGGKALIVTGKISSKKNGSLMQMQSALDSLNIKYITFDEVEENPSLETIEKAANVGKEEKVQFVIGIGGGSPLDAAKAIAVFIKNPHVNKENIFFSKKLESLPVVAVPTTSGTGSEVTPYSIVTVHKEKTKKNLGQLVYPVIAYMDPGFTDNLPYHITVNTAIDAFTHLVESYLNRDCNLMTEIYAMKGFELFKSSFENLVGKELTCKFRENIMLASMYGGIAISQSGTSLPHGMGYALTYHKNIPHGLANGLLTIEYLRCFKNQEKIINMLNVLGMENIDQLDRVFQSLIQVDIEISSQEIKEYASDFANNKEKLRKHPEEVTLKNIEGIYKNSLY